VAAVGPVLHALETIAEEFDYLVLLQPTSPLRIAADIDRCIAKCISEHAPACATVSIAAKNPYWMYSMDDCDRLVPILKRGTQVALRQQAEGIYVLNGAVYVVKIDWFRKNRKFIAKQTVACRMPQARSVDIDTQWDLRICDMLYRNRAAFWDLSE